MRCAHSRAALSEMRIPIGPYEDPAREGIQSPREIAHVFAGVTNRQIPHCASLPQTPRPLQIARRRRTGVARGVGSGQASLAPE